VSGIEPSFLSTSPFDPTVVFRIAKQRGCRIIHASSIKAAVSP
jgi:hypothetical protein